MTTKRRSYAATYARSDSTRSDTGRRTTTPRRKRSTPARQKYGAIFFVVMGVTIASALGFMSVIASVMAGS